MYFYFVKLGLKVIACWDKDQSVKLVPTDLRKNHNKEIGDKAHGVKLTALSVLVLESCFEFNKLVKFIFTFLKL